MRKLRRTIAALGSVVLLASVMVIGSGTPASSHRSETSVSLRVSDRTVRPRQRVVFFGRLRGDHLGCRRNQMVELVRRGTGVVASDETDSEGEFRMRHDPQPNRGRYFARYRGRGKFGYRGRHSCAPDISRTIRIRRQR